MSENLNNLRLFRRSGNVSQDGSSNRTADDTPLMPPATILAPFYEFYPVYLNRFGMHLQILHHHIPTKI